MRHGGLTLLNPFALLEYAHVASGWVIADLGCGSLGHFVFPAAKMVGSHGRVYAVDVQRSAVRRIEREAREHQYWHVKPVWSDVEQVAGVQVPTEIADLTLIVNALYLSSVPEVWMKEAWRMTKPGGSVFVVDWQPQAQPLGPPLSARLDPIALRETFCQHGWKHTSDFAAGDHHYGILLERPTVSDTVRVEFISHPTI